MKTLKQLFFATLTLAFTLPLAGCNLAVLNPKGVIAADQKELLLTAVGLMLIVVIPVIILTMIIAWRYRAGNTKATYSPDWAHSTILEVIWWTIPCIIIAILSVITWISSHQLDPYKPITSNVKPITIQAIALDWKWLFIYPDQKIATVNYVEIPVNTPVEFLITADAPMNSFEIPQLAGQIYAMAGMQTKLSLMASQPGDYNGFSSNYSGHGFSDMRFVVSATDEDSFKKWVKVTKKSHDKLDNVAYNQLVLPSENNPVQYFAVKDDSIFNNVVMKGMMPMPGTNDTQVASKS